MYVYFASKVHTHKIYIYPVLKAIQPLEKPHESHINPVKPHQSRSKPPENPIEHHKAA